MLSNSWILFCQIRFYNNIWINLNLDYYIKFLEMYKEEKINITFKYNEFLGISKM